MIMGLVWQLEAYAAELRKKSDRKRYSRKGKKYLPIRWRGVAFGMDYAAAELRKMVEPTQGDPELDKQLEGL